MTGGGDGVCSGWWEVASKSTKDETQSWHWSTASSPEATLMFCSSWQNTGASSNKYVVFSVDPSLTLELKYEIISSKEKYECIMN